MFNKKELNLILMGVDSSIEQIVQALPTLNARESEVCLCALQEYQNVKIKIEQFINI